MGTRQARERARKASRFSEVVISGRGLAFSVLDIDQDTFERFTRAGISSAEFNNLRDQLDDADAVIAAPFLDETTVAIDGQAFHASWDNIKGQCGGTLPAVTRIYAVSPGTHSVILAHLVEGDFVRARVANFDPAKLTFDLERVELSKGREYVLLDPYYDGEALASGDSRADADIYVVDGNGKRHEIKLAVGVVAKDGLG